MMAVSLALEAYTPMIFPPDKPNVIYVVDRTDLEAAGWNVKSAIEIPDIGLPPGCVINATSIHQFWREGGVCIRVYDPSRLAVPQGMPLPFVPHAILEPPAPIVVEGTSP